MNVAPAWSTWGVPGQSGLQRDFVKIEKKKKKDYKHNFKPNIIEVIFFLVAR